MEQNFWKKTYEDNLLQTARDKEFTGKLSMLPPKIVYIRVNFTKVSSCMENFPTVSRLGLSEQAKQTFIFLGLLNSWFTVNYIKHAAIIPAAHWKAQLKTNFVK